MRKVAQNHGGTPQSAHKVTLANGCLTSAAQGPPHLKESVVPFPPTHKKT